MVGRHAQRAEVQLQARPGRGNGDQVAARQVRRIDARKAGTGDAARLAGRLLARVVRVRPVAVGGVLALAAARMEADQLAAQRREAEVGEELGAHGGLGDAACVQGRGLVRA